MTIETNEVRNSKILGFAQRRLRLPDVIKSTYVDSNPLWQRKQIEACLRERLGRKTNYYDFWGWLTSENGQRNIKTFADCCEQNQLLVQDLSQQLTGKNSDPSLTTSQRITNRYWVEYANVDELRENGYRLPEQGLTQMRAPTYDSFSPAVNEAEFFKRLVLDNTNLGKQIPRITVLDVAAGRGRFSQFMRTLGVSTQKCVCVDISPTSSARTKEQGFQSITGDIKKVTGQIKETFDLIYLGYCIDRDDQPKETLERIRKLLRPEGTLILEGLLPVVPQDSLGTVYTDQPDRITEGKTLVDDAVAITDFVKNSGNGLKLVAFALGPKLVRSLDGPELLSSSTFVFAKEKSTLGSLLGPFPPVGPF